MVPLRAAGAAAMGKSSKGLVVVIALGVVAASTLHDRSVHLVPISSVPMPSNPATGG